LSQSGFSVTDNQASKARYARLLVLRCSNRWVGIEVTKVLDLLERSIYRMPETEIAMDIVLPAENGGRVSYKLVGDPVEGRKLLGATGGTTQGNVFARGIIQDGGYRYVTLMEDGIPIYPVSELSFYNPDQFVRVDETIDHVEAYSSARPVAQACQCHGPKNALRPSSRDRYVLSKDCVKIRC